MPVQGFLNSLSSDPTEATLWLVTVLVAVEIIRVAKGAITVAKGTKQAWAWVSLQFRHWKRGKAEHFKEKTFTPSDQDEDG